MEEQSQVHCLIVISGFYIEDLCFIVVVVVKAVHCHVLEHEDQGAMGTVWINGGCDGDYNSIEEDGSCEYVDECHQFGTLSPTLSPIPTPEPTSSPTTEPSTDSPTAQPTYQPTLNPAETSTFTEYELVLRGVFANFENDAESLTNGNVSELALLAIEEALDYASNPQLQEEVEVTVIAVERPKVTVTYMMEGMNVNYLVEAIALIDGMVTDGIKFEPATNKYLYYSNTEVVGFTAMNEMFAHLDDEWTISEILTIIMVVLATCCLVVFFILSGYCLQKTFFKRHEVEQQMSQAQVVSSSKFTVQLSPLESDGVSPDIGPMHSQKVPSCSMMTETELQEELDKL